MKNDKRHLRDEMILPYQGKIRNFGENETYKYLGILETDAIKQVNMKETRKLLETKLKSRNLIKEINA